MRKFLSLVVLFTLVAFTGSLAMAKDMDVQIKKDPKMGNYLTDGKGMTLYWFKKDSPGKSACSGPCIEKWPAFKKEKVSVGKGLKKEDFGTITRDDGTKQTTYKDYPLYYWANDKKAGDTTGNGFNDVWSVVNPDKFPPK